MNKTIEIYINQFKYPDTKYSIEISSIIHNWVNSNRDWLFIKHNFLNIVYIIESGRTPGESYE